MHSVIDGITHRGEGVARINKKAVFVPFTIPGEEINIHITSENKRFSRGRIKTIKKVSEDRVEPLCPHFYTCGGCVYQHVNYDRELKLKQKVVEDNIKRIGKLDIPVNPIIGLENPWRYRNKITWHLFKNTHYELGYYRYDDNHLFPVQTCKLIPEIIETISNKTKMILNKFIVEGCTEIIVRCTSLGDKMLIFYGEELVTLPKDLIAYLKDYTDSIYLVNKQTEQLLEGKKTIREKVSNINYDISPLSFFQVNHIQTERLFTLVKELGEFKKEETVLDAYCGIGAISLYIADSVEKVIGIESYEKAVIDARHNAKLNNIKNCTFIAGDVEKVLPKLNEKYDTVIVDPPRAGCDKEMLNTLCELQPNKIIYVSCNPSTLARDLAVINNNGYNPKIIQPIDMFPQTHHVECVVLIERE
ncbi:RNA methyltransferase, TrmA family [Candidatus Syntrophocurvum alkaliphilum]|uniref:RNA methyltransferase, TrmA family n=1 Tax=Candidatus Syntrophocurvum alkaliphilum TaxID=2293317 RepID=A0A6I6DB55_9FIRM|nr:23S rRNA (uracil(1939)-C(5))-methyltransferase RlmD [Candidatus Syntrophocurvum alkaliphilum]QGT99549.1 RNA methyltransferase, TrmA family [Candidatus Syntrophocurvum alkaliphilum]